MVARDVASTEKVLAETLPVEPDDVGPHRLPWLPMRRPGTFVVRAVAALCLLLGPAIGVATNLAEPAAALRPQQNAQLPPPKAQIVVDATTGAVLAGDHVHDALPAASLTKIMTAVVAAERLAGDALIPVSARAADMPPMKITMQAGQEWPFEQAMASLMMVSANDAAYALAEAVGGGSLDAFEGVARDTSERLGLRDSTLSDPSGLDDESSYKGGSRMSAYDLAIATRNALTVPVISKYAGLAEHQFVDPAGRTRYLPNHNKLVVEGPYHYAGATGFKTGYTDRAQHSVVATATRNGRTLIAVVIGAPTLGYTEAAGLLDVGFATPADAKGAGEPLPDIAVSPYAARLADREAFGALAAPAGDSGSSVLSASSIPVEAAAPIAAREAPAAENDSDSGGGGGGVMTMRNVVIVGIAFLFVLVMLRRRAVKRQRTRRIARQRARAAQMRSGGLPVVDGRYRPGMRLGPPVESHVTIRRAAGPPPRRHGTG
jgi:D-alanyl-D-alanine carboxypeptidase (penicillin-binding protein 5/6)